jgi:hypothetical protein
MQWGISALPATTATTATSGTGAATWSGASRRAGGAGGVGRMQASVTAVAQLLKTTPAELVQQLGKGQSMSSLAAAKGVSPSSLLATVSKAVASTVPQGAQPLSGSLLDSVSSRIAATTSLPAGFHVPAAR